MLLHLGLRGTIHSIDDEGDCLLAMPCLLQIGFCPTHFLRWVDAVRVLASCEVVVLDDCTPT